MQFDSGVVVIRNWCGTSELDYSPLEPFCP